MLPRHSLHFTLGHLKFQDLTISLYKAAVGLSKPQLGEEFGSLECDKSGDNVDKWVAGAKHHAPSKGLKRLILEKCPKMTKIAWISQ